jgi:hypothetical protein
MSSKSAVKTRQPRSMPQVDKEMTRPGRERRPSDKIAARRKCLIHSFFKSQSFLKGLEEQEADLLKAQKEERRVLREKKALQKANQRANLPSDGEGDYVPREIPTVCIHRPYIIFTNDIVVSFSRGS